MNHSSTDFTSPQLSLNPEGRWGTTNDFTTNFLHFSVFFTALWDLANSRSVHSLMLSSHLPLKGCWVCLMSSPCLESQSCHLIPLYYLLSCSSADYHCSFCLVFTLLLTNPPDVFFSPPTKFINIFPLEIGFVQLLFSSQEMIAGLWYAQHAAIGHWYPPLCVHNIFF